MKNHCWVLVLLTILVVAGNSAGIAFGQEDAAKLVEQARVFAATREFAKAISSCDRAIELAPAMPEAYYVRGRCRFASGLVNESLADFKKYLQLRPAHESRLWERGISLYYAGRYAEGARQFALYQTYFTNDVENSVWRYLCMARSDDVAKARKEMLPIKQDRRVPMMEIYALFAGRATADDVLRAADTTGANKAQLNHQMFYAHLYLGLFYEADGDEALAAKHLAIAAEKHKIGHYMWDVANVHSKRLRKAATETKQ